MTALRALVRALRSWTCPLCGCHNDNDPTEGCVYCLPDDM
ncbi:hypothetical protein SSCG_01810 [Streptomyces clavuligerus]|nr:hypothetical protein SSCG_01810 [Streptomyces clavuligerus]